MGEVDSPFSLDIVKRVAMLLFSEFLLNKELYEAIN